MNAQTEKLVNKYLSFSGDKTYNDFQKFLTEIISVKAETPPISKEYKYLEYLEKKAIKGMYLCKKYSEYDFITVIVDEDSIEDIDEEIKKEQGLKGYGKRRADLGKIVDHGKVSPRGNSDLYWGRVKIDLIFSPDDEKVRVGDKLPEGYKYTDMRYLENYYGLRAFEFGNWLSQQDRANYLAGLGIALFDLHKVLGIKPEKLSIKNKLAVAFGARGRGAALAHFEPGSFVINLCRYSRPPQESTRPTNFRRVSLILKDGGVGAFAHEYGHALDYFGGKDVEPGDTLTLSGDDSIKPAPNAEHIKKNTLRGLMERLMYKIIWKNAKEYTPYYQKLIKKGTSKYYKQRNEIFARAFEVYVQYKLEQEKHKNIFLTESKYEGRYYMNEKEMKRVLPEFDALINGLKKYL